MKQGARIVAASLLLFAGVAGAQTDQPTAPGGEAVLGGPKVRASAHATTLVERDEVGHVKRLDIPPAEAALKLLDLDEATKTKTQAILDKRAAILDGIVRENLLLLVNLANAGKSGDKKEQRELFRELAQKAGPLRDRGPLQDELAGVLPAEKATKLKELVQEYAKAIVADAEKSGSADEMQGEDKEERPGGAGRAGGRAGGRAAQVEYAAAIGRELKRSYERVVTAAGKDFDELIKALNLTPEQEADVRRIAADHFQKTAGNPSKKQKGEVFAEIYSKLNAEQRKILLERARGKAQ